MNQLRQREIQGVLECLGQLYALHNVDTFGSGVLPLLSGVIPADFNLCSEMNLRRQRVATFAHPHNVSLALSPDEEACYFREHPFVRYHIATGKGRGLREPFAAASDIWLSGR